MGLQTKSGTHSGRQIVSEGAQILTYGPLSVSNQESLAEWLVCRSTQERVPQYHLATAGDVDEAERSAAFVSTTKTGQRRW